LGIWYGHRKNEQYTKFSIARHEAERRKEYELLVEEAKVAFAAQKDKELAAAVAPRTWNLHVQNGLTSKSLSTPNHTGSSLRIGLNSLKSSHNLKRMLPRLPVLSRNKLRSSGTRFKLNLFILASQSTSLKQSN